MLSFRGFGLHVTVLAAALGLVVVGLVTSVLSLRGPDLLAWPTVLPLPPRGTVEAVHVRGTPEWLVHEDDGTVLVVSAVSLRPGTHPRVTAYCEDAGWIVDPLGDGMAWRSGAYLGGPWPTGLPSFEVLAVSAREVTVGDLGPPPARDALRPPDGLASLGCSATQAGHVWLLHEPRAAGLRYPELELTGSGGPTSRIVLPDAPQLGP